MPPAFGVFPHILGADMYVENINTDHNLQLKNISHYILGQKE